MMYIVGIWHLGAYSPYLPELHVLPGSWTVTYWCLGLFFVISGFLLSVSYAGISGISEVRSFYRRRVLRLYPLYVAALLGCRVLHICAVSRGTLIDSVLLVAIFRNNAPATLWFVNLIMVYYLVTPLLICGGRRRYLWWLLLALLSLCLLLVSVQSDLVDMRLIQYAPSYAMGLLLGLEPGLRNRLLSGWGMVATLAGCAMVLALGNVTGNTGQFLVWALCPPLLAPPVWGLAKAAAARPHVAAVCRNIGYLSFAAYLIHRITYDLASRVFYPDNVLSAWAYWCGLVLPVTLATAFLVQVLYDRVLAALSPVTAAKSSRLLPESESSPQGGHRPPLEHDRGGRCPPCDSDVAGSK